MLVGYKKNLKLQMVWQSSYIVVDNIILSNPKFAEYARGCGALGLLVNKKEELHDAMKTLMDHDGPGLLEIKTDVKLI